MNNSIIWSNYTKSPGRSDWYSDIAEWLHSHIQDLIAVAQGVEPYRVSLAGATVRFYKYREGYYRDVADSIDIEGAHPTITKVLDDIKKDLYAVNGKL